MYSRNQRGRSSVGGRSITIPDNYSGNAFFEKTAATDPFIPADIKDMNNEPHNDLAPDNQNRAYEARERSNVRTAESGEESGRHWVMRNNAPLKVSQPDNMQINDENLNGEQNKESAGECGSAEACDRKNPAPFQGLFSKDGGHGLSFEDLMLIGLILLMSQGEEYDDMILILALLLLYR